MERRIAIIAALPGEIAGLVEGTKPDRSLKAKDILLHRTGRAIVVAAGMGAERAALAFEAALAEGEVREVVSIGLVGACTPDVAAGTALEVGTVVNTQTGERYATTLQRNNPVLVSVASIADVGEKARLSAAYHAAVVDMEAATVARLAQAHGLGFRAMKGVSDAHDFDMTLLAEFAGKHGQFRTGAFVLHTVFRPWTWGTVVALGRNSKRALAAMNELVNGSLNARD